MRHPSSPCLLFFALLLSLSAQAELVRGINFPSQLGPFELMRVIDNEKSNPGFGASVLYNAPGIKATVFIYDYGHGHIPDGIGSPSWTHIEPFASHRRQK